MWICVALGLLLLFTYISFVWIGLEKKWGEPNPDCVTCNGWPVTMVSYTWGYFGDFWPHESLCIEHQIQAQRIANLEAAVLDK